MAFSDFRKNGNGYAQPSGGAAYIDTGAELSGKLRFGEAVRIDGRVEGEVESPKAVIVGDTGYVRAEIRGEEVVIYGTVEGNITASRKITLHEHARVKGNMRTVGIVIQEGARVEGRIHIGGKELAVDKAASQTAAKRPARDAGKPAPVQPSASA